MIFDEVQTLPVNLTEYTMEMLNDLLHPCRYSLLFCTATQPDFQTRKDFCGIDHITSFVENPVSIFVSTKRVRYISIDDCRVQSFENIAGRMAEQNDSVFIVCNTKKKVTALLEHLKTGSEILALHLLTNMCQVYKIEVIKRVRIKLKGGEKLTPCSIQLTEVGTDMDFPVVFGELAPLESVIQSAGRCSREGSLKGGQVYLSQLGDQGQSSRQYIASIQFVQLCYRGNEDRLSDADFYANYYTNIIKNYLLKDNVTPK